MTGVKYGGDAEWDYVWQRFLQTQTPSEKSKLLQALAATNDGLKLSRLVLRDWTVLQLKLFFRIQIVVYSFRCQVLFEIRVSQVDFFIDYRIRVFGCTICRIRDSFVPYAIFSCNKKLSKESFVLVITN